MAQDQSFKSFCTWQYDPNRQLPLPPAVDYEKLTQELLQSDDSDPESTEEEHFASPTKKVSYVLNKSFNDDNLKHDKENIVKIDPPVAEKSPVEEYAYNKKLSPISEGSRELTGILTSKDQKKQVMPLNLTALCFDTPQKPAKNVNFVTPKINIIPSTETKANLKPTGNYLFKTPLGKLPEHNLHSNRKPMRTPIVALEEPIRMPIIYSVSVKRMMVNTTEYTILNQLGKGGSSEVYCGFNEQENLQVAIKIVTLSNSQSAEGFINEVKLLESLQHCDRIITMYDYEIRDDKLLVVLECGGEDFRTILKTLAIRQAHLPVYMLLFYWMEMLYAVKQLHEHNVIHSDLKPANFLRAAGGLKLIDFGIASEVQGDMTCVFKTSQEGSCNYISPEALSTQSSSNVNSPSFGKPKYKIHFKSDVWSLGCILYQLVYRRTPFEHIHQLYSKLAAITNKDFPIDYPEANWVPPRIINTIKKCLQHNIAARPSVEELINEYENMLKVF